MMQDISLVTGSVLTLFLVMGVGYALAKLGILAQSTLPQLSKILLYVVTPAIMVDSFQVERTQELDQQLLEAVGVLVGTYLLYMVLGQLCFRRRPPEERGVMRFSAIYGNIGFMGLPLIEAVLGNEAMMITVIAMGVFNVASWTHGIACIGGKENSSLRKALLNPGVLGFAVAFILYLARVELPWPVGNAAKDLADLNTPLAMIVVGAQMASADLKETFRDVRLYLVSAIKLLVMPAITILMLLPLHLNGMIFTTLVILSGCPTGGSSSLFCQMLGLDSSLAAKQVTFSTLLCIVTLPLVTLAVRILGT